MSESWLAPVSFAAYLEAKIEVDDGSLAPRLLERVRHEIRSVDSPRLLDVGTGTGAMLRRLLGSPLRGRPELFGLDPEPGSLAMAARRIRGDLEARGFAVAVNEGPDRIVIEGSQGPAVPEGCRVCLERGGLLDGGLTERLGRRDFDLISAHAVLDLLPLEESLKSLRGLLHPGGWLYATLNYDGLTVLLPPYEDPELEQALLELYDLSMDQRRVAGRKTAGRWSGRRLCLCLPDTGFSIAAVGASDWMVFPLRGSHSDSRRLFLGALLTFMAREGLASGGLDPKALERWYRRRLGQIEDGALCLLTHQLDVLAEAVP